MNEEYLNETVYFKNGHREEDWVPVGCIKDYISLSESETAKLLYQRLNRNQSSANIKSIDRCREIAHEIREEQISQYLEQYLEQMVEVKAAQLQILENISMYDSIFEMANFPPQDSGLPYAIWFDEDGIERSVSHNIPRVKILTSNKNFIPVSIEKTPKILLKGIQLSKAEKELRGSKKAEMFKFISDNHELILQHWNKKITTLTLFKRLMKK